MPKPSREERADPKEEDLKSLPLSAIIRAFNEDLVSSFSEEEGMVSWEDGDDGGPKGGGGYTVRLEKELHMARLILLEKTKSGDEKLDPKFLISLVKLLSKSEKAVGWYGDQLNVWRRFLAAIIERMEKEPLEVYDKKLSKPIKPTGKKLIMDFEKPAGEGRQ